MENKEVLRQDGVPTEHRKQKIMNVRVTNECKKDATFRESKTNTDLKIIQ